MKVEYGKWTRGMLPVNIDGEFAGYLTEDADGWVFWSQIPDMPNCFEMSYISPTRKEAVAKSVGEVLVDE